MFNKTKTSSSIFAVSLLGLSLVFAAPAFAQHDGHDHSAEGLYAEMAGSTKPVAYVNGDPITEGEIALQMQTLPHMFIEGRDDEVRQAVVERIVQQRLVVEEAKKMDVETDPEFQSQLKTIKENLIFNFVISDILDRELTPTKMKQYYEDHGFEYAFPSVKAAHILVKTEDEAKSIIKRLDKGEKFSDLAIENSTGPAAIKGGMLGWLARNTMVEPFEKVVFELDAGAYSKVPVQTQFGWHVIKVYEKDPNHIPDYEELEGEIQYKLGEQIVQDYLQGLQEKAKVTFE